MSLLVHFTVHSLFTVCIHSTLCTALALNFARTGPKRKTCECGFNGTLNIVTLDLGSLTWPRGEHFPKVLGCGGGRGEEGCMEIEMGNGHFEVQFILSKLFSVALCQ